MKSLPLWLLLVVIFTSFAFGADDAPKTVAADHSPTMQLASTVSTVTGIAISPLLGTGAYGAYQWFQAKDEAAREKLPWFAQMKFWLPALLIVAICAGKDALGTALPPGLKKPLDMLETFENKISGLVAAGAVIPFVIDALSKMTVSGKTSAMSGALMPEGLAMIHLGAMDFSWLLNVLMIPLGIATFAVVWMASHAINVLILLSPWGAIDAALKVARTSLLGLLVATAAINPWLGAALSVVVIVVAWLVAGWAYRLTVFGWVFCWDFCTGRSGRFSPRENDNAMFAGPNLPGVPVRTSGRLVLRTEGGLEFFYRPAPWRAGRAVRLPAQGPELGVDRGLFFSTIGAEQPGTLLLLPPRYRGHEDVLVRAYFMGGGVREAGLRKAWGVLRELFGGGAARTQII